MEASWPVLKNVVGPGGSELPLLESLPSSLSKAASKCPSIPAASDGGGERLSVYSVVSKAENDVVSFLTTHKF